MRLMRFMIGVVPLLLLAACAAPPDDFDGASSLSSRSSSFSSSVASADVTVFLPRSGARVESPLVVTGQARGTWYFEASFPVKLLDVGGNVLAQGSAQAQGDWMTEDSVPFSATLTFTPPATQTGTLVLSKDNPSGLPENAGSVEIPVTF